MSKGNNSQDINARDIDGWTPLYEAVKANDLESVTVLINKGADVDAKALSGWTPLHVAASQGAVKIAESLLAHGANIEAQDKDGWTPLYVASKTDHIKVVELLLKKGANIDAQTRYDWSALYEALLAQQSQRVEFLLKNGTQTTPIFETAMDEDEKGIAKFLLKNGANADKVFHKVIDEKDLDTANFLLSIGANFPERYSEAFVSASEYHKSEKEIILAYEDGCFPIFYSIRDDAVLLCESKSEDVEELNAFVTSLALKCALKLPQGQTKYHLVDPIKMGNSCSHLYNLDKKFYEKVYTSKEDIDSLLSLLESHTAYVNSNYLKGSYASLEHYNEENPDVAESTIFVILYDYALATSQEQKTRFERLFSEGRSVGVKYVVTFDSESRDAFSKERLAFDFLHVDLSSDVLRGDTLLSAEQIRESIAYLNQGIKEASNTKVNYISTKPSTFWSKDSSTKIEANIGKVGRDPLLFTINNQIESHALLIGRSGSGKSNLLHILISDLILNYSPNDINLYLVDMKGGIEFIKYTQMELPHLEIASITSDREMALAILKKLENKLAQREKLFSSKGVQNIEQYNSAHPQDKQARIVLVLDEFQELFTREDTIKREATDIFDRVSKKGRSFGINMILASQSLGGDTLAASTVNQFAIRIVLQCSEDDSRRVLSFDNAEAKYLSRPGEGIYNSQNGSVIGNRKFQTYWLETKEHDEILNEVSRFALQNAQSKKSVVFREDLVPSFVESYASSRFEKSKKEIVFGQPYGFEEFARLKLQKTDAANLLICGNAQLLAGQIMSIFLLSLALDRSSKKSFYLYSGGESDESALSEYAEVLKGCDVDLLLLTKRNIPEVFTTLNQKIEHAIAEDSKMEHEHYVFIDNGYKMKSLRKDVDEYGSGRLSDEGALLSGIINKGSEFGVHSFVYVESMKHFDMIFEYSTLKNDFNNLVALQMSEDDSQKLAGNYNAANLTQETAIFIVDDANTEVKFRPFELPATSWLEHTLS